MTYLTKLQEIDRLQQQIEAAGQLSEDVRKKINYKFRLDWNYHSNSMEGNTLTLDETRSVMINNLTIEGKPLRDVIEMRGHDNVVKEMLAIGKGEARLSEKRLKEIHKAIVHEDDPEKQGTVGQWKTKPNYLYNYKKERFDFVAPELVADRMHSLLNTTNAAIDAIFTKKKNAQHPVTLAFWFHLEYVSIHPFHDGNGRTARLLSNLILIACGYPPLIIDTKEKDTYNRYLADIQSYGGEPDLLYSFLADKLLRSQQLVLDALAGKAIDEPSDIDKEIFNWKMSLDHTRHMQDNDELVYQTYTYVIAPILQAFSDRIYRNFSTLFETIQILGSNGVETPSLSGINQLDEYFKRFAQQQAVFLKPGEAPPNAAKLQIERLLLIVDLKRFLKNELNAFSKSFELEVLFRSEIYGITFDGQTVFKHNYLQSVSEAQIMAIADQLVRFVFENIKLEIDKKG